MSISHTIRAVLFAALLLVCVAAQPSYAQEAQTPSEAAATGPQAQETATTQSPDSEPQTSAPLTTAPEVKDLDQALTEALAARRAADQAIIDALLAQEKSNALAEAQDTGGAADAPKGKSWIPKSAADVKALALSIWEKIFGWLTSAAFLAQVGAIAAAMILSPLIARSLRKRVRWLREPPAETMKMRPVFSLIYRTGMFLRAIVLIGLLALAAIVLKAVPSLGQDWLVKLAQGLAVVFLVYRAINTFIRNPLVKKGAVWFLIPLALLLVFGLYDDVTAKLDAMVFMTIGDQPITAITVVRLLIFGALFMWLGKLSNARGQSAIRSQETLDVATQEVVAKMFQILLSIVMFVLILSAAGIPLSGLVVIFSAIGLGIGFGLQPIAANFISGLIILFDRSVKVGDFIEMENGSMGFVEAINMRSTTVETTDGKDVMVPNVKFIEEAYLNWTHKDPSQRYEVEFVVAYDTDLDALEDIIVPAVLAHPDVLREPELPDLEFRSFGESGIHMAIEFWCVGIDDGENKYTSDIGFILWRTLKAHKIKIPLPQRVVHNRKA